MEIKVHGSPTPSPRRRGAGSDSLVDARTGVYVHGFRRLSVGQEPELAMPVGALAADAGIVLANVMGLFLQACLYEVNGIDGAAVPWRLPGCRARW